jgi:chaperonin GroES
MEIKLKPISDRIVVKREDVQDKTTSGIYIPDVAKDKPQQGVVLAVGAGKVLSNGTLVSPNVKVGDKILFNKFSGIEVKVDNQLVLIMKEDDIIGIIE